MWLYINLVHVNSEKGNLINSPFLWPSFSINQLSQAGSKPGSLEMTSEQGIGSKVVLKVKAAHSGHAEKCFFSQEVVLESSWVEASVIKITSLLFSLQLWGGIDWL